MKQEDKELLLKDLCGRLPYGVKVIVPSLGDKIYTLKAVRIEDGCIVVCEMGDNGEISMPIECVKPYLFPLSSMTEEQKQYLKNRFCYDWDGEPYDLWKYQIEIGNADGLIDWFLENHFDFRCLIPKGLAKDATGLNVY